MSIVTIVTIVTVVATVPPGSPAITNLDFGHVQRRYHPARRSAKKWPPRTAQDLAAPELVRWRIPIYSRAMSRRISVPFSHLVLYHGEIGVHRGRKAGFRTVFGYRTLYNLPFAALAKKVRDAYQGKRVPEHDGWPSQREALRWFVEKGRDGIYARDTKPIRVRECPHDDDHYYILGGHHRSLALFILGDTEIHASLKRH